jgi:hypothetical protein
MSNVANATDLANGANVSEAPAATGVSLPAIRVQVERKTALYWSTQVGAPE